MQKDYGYISDKHVFSYIFILLFIFFFFVNKHATCVFLYDL